VDRSPIPQPRSDNVKCPKCNEPIPVVFDGTDWMTKQRAGNRRAERATGVLYSAVTMLVCVIGYVLLTVAGCLNGGQL